MFLLLSLVEIRIMLLKINANISSSYFQWKFLACFMDLFGHPISQEFNRFSAFDIL